MAQYYGEVRLSKIISVHDGDTFTATITDWPSVIGQKIVIRISGIDTPELYDRSFAVRSLAAAAHAALSSLLFKASEVKIKRIMRDKYFRLNAAVECDGVDVATALIAAGHARPYTGGKRLPW